MNDVRDVVIVGGGPAGAAAAVYAERKCLLTTLILDEWGGQSIVSTDIQNWVGTPHISGADLAKSLSDHVRAYSHEGMDIIEGDRVERVEKSGDHFIVHTKKTVVVKTRTVLIASGAVRRKLTVPGADMFEHKGVTYCASCDGPLFTGQDVVVVGGGNAGFDTASQLLAYTKSVTLIHKNKEFKADPVTVMTVSKHPAMKTVNCAEITSIVGETFVSGITYKDGNGDEHTLPATGVFVEIGTVPASDMVQELVDRDAVGHIVVHPKTQRSSCEGIWAAGDVTDALYHQNNIAAGDAVKALEDIYLFLKTQ